MKDVSTEKADESSDKLRDCHNYKGENHNKLQICFMDGPSLGSQFWRTPIPAKANPCPWRNGSALDFL